MNKTKFNPVDSTFKVNQIVCLDFECSCLYGEVIQLIPQRRLCWFRPICITTDLAQDQALDNRQIIGLQSDSDLLWPISFFRVALDVEVISWLSDLNNTNNVDQKTSRRYLNQFVQQVWQANQDQF